VTKILAFAGEKQSGKSSSGNFLAGLLLQEAGTIKRSRINEDGKLIVNALYKREDGSSYEDDGILDLDRRDPEFFEYASRKIWPFVKLYSFAEYLKETSINFFGLDRACVYGTNEQKNKPTTIKWATIKKFMKESYYEKTGFMTHREFMEFFGTDICRAILPSCHSQSCLKLIKEEAPQYAIIIDCRFEDELEAVKEAGGISVRLTRTLGEENKSKAEQINGLSPKKFTINIDNANMTINEKNDAILAGLHSINWFAPQEA
jgi:hypothetical protein